MEEDCVNCIRVEEWLEERPDQRREDSDGRPVTEMAFVETVNIPVQNVEKLYQFMITLIESLFVLLFLAFVDWLPSSS